MSAAKVKGPPTPTKALRGYDDTYLLCRNLGHVWEVLGYYRGDAGEVRRTLRCARCETERTDRWLRGTGERLQGHYKYGPEYRLEVEGGHMPAVDVRLEVIRRATVYANESQMLNSLTNGKR